MKFDIKKISPDKHKVNCLVHFAFQDTKKDDSKKNDNNVDIKTLGLPKPLEKIVNQAIKDKIFNAKENEALFFRLTGLNEYTSLLLVGLGYKEKISNEILRKASATAFNSLKSYKITQACIVSENIHLSAGSKSFQAMVEGFILANYNVDFFKSDQKNSFNFQNLTLLVDGGDSIKDIQKQIQNGEIIAQATNFARWLGDSPGNHMTADLLAKDVIKACEKTSIRVTVWNKDRIKKEKMGAFLSVTNGSHDEPRFIIMEYQGTNKAQQPICLIGKGLTFDSGGICIKPGAGMEEMKYDMCGAANVIGAVIAIANLKLPVNVNVYIPATDNMPSGSATKPGDIVTARNGKTIEVNNTDAEGRLILADALVYACEQNPRLVLDAATLTGAITIALGNIHTGVFTRQKDSELREKIMKASELSGENLWPMPLVEYHSDDMKGTFADLSNISNNKSGAGSATAAAFLEAFVKDGIPWAHFDIAGTAYNTGSRLPYCPKKGASGVLIRTIVELVSSF